MCHIQLCERERHRTKQSSLQVPSSCNITHQKIRCLTHVLTHYIYWTITIQLEIFMTPPSPFISFTLTLHPYPHLSLHLLLFIFEHFLPKLFIGATFPSVCCLKFDTIIFLSLNQKVTRFYERLEQTLLN